MKRALFFSGTHGAGKTTSIERVNYEIGSRIFDSFDGDHGNPYEQPFSRQVWRLNKYYLDSLEIKTQELQTTQKSLLLVDRCAFDHEAYTNSFYHLGWLTTEQYDQIEKLRKVYFSNKFLLPRNVVLFFPPEKWTIDRIKQRWNEEKKKWNEGDFEYLKILRQQYQEIYEREGKNQNILIVKETGLEKRLEKILRFIEKIRG